MSRPSGGFPRAAAAPPPPQTHRAQADPALCFRRHLRAAAPRALPPPRGPFALPAPGARGGGRGLGRGHAPCAVGGAGAEGAVRGRRRIGVLGLFILGEGLGNQPGQLCPIRALSSGSER